MQVGFVADDLAAIDQNLVSFSGDGQVINYNDRAVVAMLTKAIQEQQAQIEELRKQVDELTNRR